MPEETQIYDGEKVKAQDAEARKAAKEALLEGCEALQRLYDMQPIDRFAAAARSSLASAMNRIRYAADQLDIHP